jgi:hypothetical protein
MLRAAFNRYRLPFDIVAGGALGAGGGKRAAGASIKPC